MEPVGIKVDEYGQISAEVNAIHVNFLVDTGATLSPLNFEVPQISNDVVKIRRVLGEERKYLSTPLPVVLNEKLVWGKFVISPDSPVSLFGRELLQEFGTLISLTPTGIQFSEPVIGSEISQLSSQEKKNTI